MNRIAVLLVMMAISAMAFPAIRVKTASGDASVRHGVSETWVKLGPGDTLRADDAIRTGKMSSITLHMENASVLRISEQVILEMYDLRQMTQEELLLKLALQDVRSIPARPGDGEMTIPRTTTVHGENKNGGSPLPASGESLIAFHMNGAKLLYDQGYYATSILRSMEVMRLAPRLAKQIDWRLRIAGAFERVQLKLEALTEYQEISRLGLNARQKSMVEDKIVRLQKKDAEEEGGTSR